MITREDIVEGLSQMGGRSGMPRERVEACASDEKNLAAVDANWMEGENGYSVRATPTFIINGKTHVGGMSFDALETNHRPAHRQVMLRRVSFLARYVQQTAAGRRRRRGRWLCA